MKMNELIKDTIIKNKAKIEIFQWSIISSVASLVYSEFLKNMKQKEIPVRSVHVPSLKTVREFLKPDGELLEELSCHLIDKMNEDELFKKYKDKCPELVLFNEDNCEVLKTIFDLYVIPNMSRRIPEVIDKKFGLSTHEQQLFIEDNTIDLFNRLPINDDQINYIVHQTVLQLLIALQSVEKKTTFPEDNNEIYISMGEVLTVNHENAVCPIHFDDQIINNESIMALLSFVTNTRIVDTGIHLQQMMSGNTDVLYKVQSNPFNRVFTTLFIEDK